MVELLTNHNCSNKSLELENLIDQKVSYLEALSFDALESKQIVHSLLEECKAKYSLKRLDTYLTTKLNCFIIKKIQTEKNPILKQQFIMQNMKLGYSFCMKYFFLREKAIKRELDGELYEAINYAVDRFQPERGTAFSTYCYFSFHKVLLGHVIQQDYITIPKEYLKRKQRIVDAKEHFFYEYGRMPNEEELTKLTGFSEKYRAKLNTMFESCHSYETIVNDNTELSHFYMDPTAIDPQLQLEQQKKSQKLRLLLNQLLTPDEFLLIELHLGLFGKDKQTFRQLSQRFQKSLSQVHNKFHGLMKRLKQNQQMQELFYYWDHPVSQKKEGKKLKGFYKRLKDYSKEEVDELFASLSLKQQNLITSKYGVTLEEGPYKLSKEETIRLNSYINFLRNKMEKKKHPEKKNTTRKVAKVEKDFVSQPKETLDQERELKLEQSQLFSFLSQIPLNLNAENITTQRSLLIWKLRVGQIDQTQFTVTQISELMQMKEEEVKQCLQEIVTQLIPQLTTQIYQSIL